jgi:hypothetical protein
VPVGRGLGEAVGMRVGCAVREGRGGAVPAGEAEGVGEEGALALPVAEVVEVGEGAAEREGARLGVLARLPCVEGEGVSVARGGLALALADTLGVRERVRGAEALGRGVRVAVGRPLALLPGVEEGGMDCHGVRVRMAVLLRWLEGEREKVPEALGRVEVVGERELEGVAVGVMQPPREVVPGRKPVLAGQERGAHALLERTLASQYFPMGHVTGAEAPAGQYLPRGRGVTALHTWQG